MKALVIFRRELAGYFVSPIAWVVTIAFALATARIFELYGLTRTTATLTGVYGASSWVFIVAFPALTMGTLAGEFRSGTIEVLATDPVRDVEIVIGKFLAVVAFFSVSLLPLAFYYALFRFAGAHPDPGPVASGLAGLLLAGALCASIGIFASALTSSQTIAFVIAFLALLVLRLVSTTASFDIPEWMRGAFDYVSMPHHLNGFLRGRIASDDLIYFGSTTALFLFLSTRLLEARRWA